MTSGQYSFCLLLNADWLIQILEGLAVCKDIFPGFEPRRGLLFFYLFFFLCVFFFLLLFFNLLFFKFYLFIIFLIYLKGLCHGFLFLHKSRSPRTPLITLRVNSFFYCFSSIFPPFIVSGRACMTISRSTLALACSAKNINGRQ